MGHGQSKTDQLKECTDTGKTEAQCTCELDGGTWSTTLAQLQTEGERRRDTRWPLEIRPPDAGWSFGRRDDDEDSATWSEIVEAGLDPCSTEANAAMKQKFMQLSMAVGVVVVLLLIVVCVHAGSKKSRRRDEEV